LYYLDALRPSVLQRPDVYPPSFVEDLNDLFHAAQRLLSQWSAGVDGFPFSDEARPPKPSWFHVFARRLLRRLMRLLP